MIEAKDEAGQWKGEVQEEKDVGANNKQADLVRLQSMLDFYAVSYGVGILGIRNRRSELDLF